MSTVLKYPGAKWGIADWVISFFPKHHSYLEPFFGSGGVFFNKDKSNIETINDLDGEVGCYESGTILLTKSGVLLTPDCGQDDCPYFEIAKRNAKKLVAKWNDSGSPCWSFETDIPHETFEIFDDGELFCTGIVFSMEDLS